MGGEGESRDGDKDGADPGEQEVRAVEVGIVSNQHPEKRGPAGQANREPAQADGDRAHLAGVGEGDLKVQGERNGRGQISQGLLLPASQPVVVDLDHAVEVGARITNSPCTLSTWAKTFWSSKPESATKRNE